MKMSDGPLACEGNGRTERLCGDDTKYPIDSGFCVHDTGSSLYANLL